MWLDTGMEMNQSTNPTEEVIMDITTIPAGCIPTGTMTEMGEVEAVSLTAYRINGTWVPFHKIHGRPARAEAFAIPQFMVDALTPEMSDAMRRQSDANIRAMLAG